MAYLLCDIGGTFIKGLALSRDEVKALLAGNMDVNDRIRRIPSPRGNESLVDSLRTLKRELALPGDLGAAVISTPGILHASGKKIIGCANHLPFLRDPKWLETLEKEWGCPIQLINDADAFMLGVAELELLPRLGTVCSLVVGTGLGCSVVKDARFWNPGRRPFLMGSIRTPAGTYDQVASASRLAKNDPNDNLVHVLKSSDFRDQCDTYFGDLSDILLSAAILTQADSLLLGGGLCDAAKIADLDLHDRIRSHWNEVPPELPEFPELSVIYRGNEVQLIGNAALALGLEGESKKTFANTFGCIPSEQQHPQSKDLHLLSSEDLIRRLFDAEGEGHSSLDGAIDTLGDIVDWVADRWSSGGRIIYVGAGTSGRLAALDAVEIPCTFGAGRDRVVAVVAGGLAEATYRIEEDGEEDYSAVPEMVLLQPGANDVVIGISASGSSRFVQSALIYSTQRGAKTAMIQALSPAEENRWNWKVSLGSGPELVAGSTRMKAGTATKKVINALTTAAMTRIGKVHGPYMVDMACLNEKLRHRARRILQELFGLPESEAMAVLSRNDYHLGNTIADLQRPAS